MNFKSIFLTIAIAVFSLTVISCDKEVSTSPPPTPVATGFISFESNPSGAAIYLNNKNTGQFTPDSICWLEDDVYKITLKMNLFRDTTFYAQAEQNKKTKISIDYFGNPLMFGSISCSSVPSNSLILINGKETDKHTPFVFSNLKPGIYLVGYKSFGCRQDSQFVSVESNKTSKSFLELVDTTVWMNFNSSNSAFRASYLSCIAIDDYDIKWIGTDGDGLIRFDDNQWNYYTPKNSPIPGYSVNSIVIDGKIIWIGTNNGLANFDGISWKVYRSDNSLLPNNFVSSICRDPVTGNIWIGTSSGLARISRVGFGLSWTVYNTSNSQLPENAISKVAVEYGKVWIGTNTGYLVNFNGNKWTTIKRLPGEITALWAGVSYGGVWAAYHDYILGTGDIGGVYVYDNNTLTEVKDLPSRQFKCIASNSDIKWIGTADGLIKTDRMNLGELFTTSNSGLPENYIKDIAFDSNGIMWINTFTKGIVKYKIKKN